jgi:hypothetical protein
VSTVVEVAQLLEARGLQTIGFVRESAAGAGWPCSIGMPRRARFQTDDRAPQVGASRLQSPIALRSSLTVAPCLLLAHSTPRMCAAAARVSVRGLAVYRNRGLRRIRAGAHVRN